MSDEYGNDFISITDDEGNEFELEHLDTVEYNGCTYMAFLPADQQSDDNDNISENDSGLIILKVIEENGEELLSTLDDDTELESVYQSFMERLFEEE